MFSPDIPEPFTKVGETTYESFRVNEGTKDFYFPIYYNTGEDVPKSENERELILLMLKHVASHI